jgi:hypothetical protein
MNPLETFLKELAEIRFSGAANLNGLINLCLHGIKLVFI